MSRNSEPLSGEALLLELKALNATTPSFCDSLTAATGNKIGRNDAIGLFIESAGDDRGQLAAFLEDFGAHDE